MSSAPSIDTEYRLDDRYARERGRIYISGVQALVRLPIMQRQRDLAVGLDTAGFISGYRGSPLGTYDLALWRAEKFLKEHQIHFEPGVNEDLAATAVWGTQKITNVAGPKVDGVFSIWYGKGPGVDRSTDPMKHGNYAGVSEHGGVLVLCGDDPGAKSSSLAHQSEQALVHMGIPVLNPSSVQDYLDLGLYGWAMSRYSGCWVGFKCLTDTVESASSVSIDPERVEIRLPSDFEMPEEMRSGHPTRSEAALYHHRLPAAQAFARANGLDRIVLDSPRRRLGIVTTGKAYLEVRQALDALGIDEAFAAALGLSVYKVALAWPLEPVRAREFASGLEEILFVEEKRPLVEDQFAKLLYGMDSRPRILGKQDLEGRPLVPDVGELTPDAVADVLRRWLTERAPDLASRLARRGVTELPTVTTGGLARRAGFCSGCPHNTSTVVPEGSVTGGGIGCHGMASWIPGRSTAFMSHMGGEGGLWVGVAPFTETSHIFQQMGDGTYFHSGLLAIRANVAAGTNITYKILVNGAVAMTGGQPIEGESVDGTVTTPDVVNQLLAEGAVKVVVLSDDIDKYPRGLFPSGVEVYDRDRIIAVQKELREIKGVTALVFDQTCAAEARRLRKRGALPQPNKRVVINELVCEGCGDCSVQSNCISIEPIETEFGRKRRINQSSCNMDYSCVKGYCPSFATIVGGTPKKAKPDAADDGGDGRFADLPQPVPADASQPVDILVAGIGGTGVITIGALLGMAAHLEGKGCSVLDVTGLAQKNGPVTSHVRIADDPELLHATRIGDERADLLLACDIVVAASPENLTRLGPERSTAIVNSVVSPTIDFAGDPDLDLSSGGMEDAIRHVAGDDATHVLPAASIATALMGDAIATNLFLVGYALQLGKLPVGLESIHAAIELNGVAIDMNKRALEWGRLAAHDMDAVTQVLGRTRGAADEAAGSLDEMISQRADFLTEYQNAAYAARYRSLVERVREAESSLPGEALSQAVARYAFKLMAYKDEYEVARLWSGAAFRKQLETEFESGYRLEVNIAPQIFNPRDADTGRARKYALGPWVLKAFSLLARFKFLRFTAVDPFGWTAHRRLERALIERYENTVLELLEGLNGDNHEIAVQVASLPELIRGFDSIKEENVEAAESKQEELVAAFRLRALAPTS